MAWLWFIYIMNIKGLSDNQTNIDTPNDVGASEKPLNIEQTPKNRRVDINILKSRLEDRESKEFKKNVFVLSFLVIGVAVLGIYLSL